MKIAFLSNKLTIRGTEVAMYDYADFNETMLGNQSIIISRDFNKIRNHYDVDVRAYLKFKKRFPVFYYENNQDIDNIIEKEKVDVLYIIKSGSLDGLITKRCKCVIHCVFELNHPHGDVYAPISNNLNQIWNKNYPVVPHMIRVADSKENLRSQLSIPETNLVFGRYGGRETFDIGFAREVVVKVATENPNYTFLFMNTNPFCNLKNVIFIEGTEDMNMKRMFINTCDAMIHARSRGESFGLSCGEFAICGKPVISYGASTERNHLDLLGDKAILYKDSSELYHLLKNFDVKKYDMSMNGYMLFTPENVMRIFKDVFLG